MHQATKNLLDCMHITGTTEAEPVVSLYKEMYHQDPARADFHIAKAMAIDNRVSNIQRRPTKDRTNHTFGALRVLRRSPFNNIDRKTVWICKCACGATCAKNIQQLMDGKKQACTPQCTHKGELAPMPVKIPNEKQQELMKLIEEM